MSVQPSQYERAALAYAALGYPVFPLLPGEKTPATISGFHDASTDPAAIRAWWRAKPEANIGIATKGLLVLDVDGEDNPWIYEDEERASSLSGGPTQRTGNRGIQVFFRQPEGREWRNTASKLAPNVDTRANGGYVVAPPSRLGPGKAYEWICQHELLEPPSELPEPPGWLCDLLDGLASNGNFLIPSAGGVARIPGGQRNSALASLGGLMRRSGCPEAVILAALEAANSELCEPSLEGGEVAKIASSIARYEPDQLTSALVFGMPAALDEEVNRGTTDDPGPLPRELLKVPGFLERYQAHELDTCHRPQPTLGLAGGLALLSALTGRKITDRRGSQTNLYLMSVCQSGGGKDNARQKNKEILFRAGLESMIGGEGFASSAGIVSTIEASPATLFQVDEFGRLLATAGDAKVAHLFNIQTVLMKLFTSAGGLYKTDAYADVSRNKVIPWPHAVLLGTTTPGHFFESLTAESITDGFLGRMMIFEGETVLPDQRSNVEKKEVPIGVVEEARAWGDLTTGGNLSSVHPRPRRLEYTIEAQDAFEAFERACQDEQRRAPPPSDALWGRAAEKAGKLALLHAASEHGPAVDTIGVEAVDWACAMVLHLTRRMVFLAGQWVAGTEHGRRVQRVRRALRKAGAAGLTATQLSRKMSDLRSRERKEVIEDLLERKEVFTHLSQGKNGGGRPKCTFVLTSFYTKGIEADGEAQVVIGKRLK